MAYSQHIIPGAIGLNEGLVIAQCCAFTVLIFAPLGAFLTNYVGSPISVYLATIDKEAGWKFEENRYRRSSSFSQTAIELAGSTESLASLDAVILYKIFVSIELIDCVGAAACYR